MLVGRGYHAGPVLIFRKEYWEIILHVGEMITALSFRAWGIYPCCYYNMLFLHSSSYKWWRLWCLCVCACVCVWRRERALCLCKWKSICFLFSVVDAQCWAEAACSGGCSEKWSVGGVKLQAPGGRNFLEDRNVAPLATFQILKLPKEQL